MNNNYKMVKLFLEYKALVNVKDKKGNTALYYTINKAKSIINSANPLMANCFK